MITPVPIELNLNNLRSVFALISHLEAFIFFGTLLGYQRESNILPFDDDIDIYVNAKQFRELLDALAESNFEVNVLPRKKWYQWQRKPLIVQATRLQNGIQTFADFYLYDDEPYNHLVEKWNFSGRWKDKKSTIHVPKHLIFPLLDVKMQGIKIRVPAQPEAVCAFLYGPQWHVPVGKDKGYTVEIIDHIPVFCPPASV